MGKNNGNQRQPPDPPDDGLPCALDSERAILGSVLLTAVEFAHIQDLLDVSDFAIESHRRIFSGMRTLHTLGVLIDNVTLAEALGRKELASVGGLSYIVTLSNGLPELPNADSYIGIVKKAALQRRIIHQANILTKQAMMREDPAVILAAGTKAFADLQTERNGTGGGVFTYKDVPSIWRWEADVTWAVDELIPESAITLITGDSGHGKTIFTSAMAGKIATGSPFLGRATRQRRVLYLDRENPAGVVKQHLFDLKIRETPDLTVWGNWCAHEADGPASASLLKFAQENPVMIFDPSIAFHPGDEQSATETRQFMQHCRNLAAAGATVVLLHHVGKGENAKMYRGSSDYKASVDVAFLLEKLGDPAGPLKDLRLVPFKNRFGGSDILPLSFNNGVFSANKRGETCQEIMERLISDNPGESLRSLVEVARAAGLAKNQAERELSRGAKDGRFEVRKLGRSHGYYLREGGLADL